MTKLPMVQGSLKWKSGWVSLQSNKHTWSAPHTPPRGHLPVPAPNVYSSWVLCTNIPQCPIPPAVEGT